MNIKALIIDDDESLQKLLCKYFNSYNIDTFSHYTGLDVEQKIEEVKPDIIILDYMLPGNDGIDVLKIIRKKLSIPVIMLTARGDEMDRILGLELGADDYIGKPFNPREIVARIKAVLRRVPKNENQTDNSEEVITVDNIVLNQKTLRLSKGEKQEELSLTEFKIIHVLMSRAGMVFSRDELMNFARGRDATAFDRSIDMHISKLRSKLVSIGDDKDRIKTSWGSGYMFLKQI
ncbi:MAG: response regulator transcription factor [Candidatus Delongbacteria bacterium]|nr:response regulator transcription factor [Candidatus Delongbacteria bacterium]MBN2833953.1 response regulator transcription factor [Candidatus Delongbacteria bacterium]